MPTCGDAGGVTLDGSPCSFRVQEEGGRCGWHSEEGLEKRQEQKTRILEALKSGDKTMTDAAREAGVSRVVVWRWRQADEEFDRALDEAVPDEAMQLRMVEESTFHRIMKGEVSGALQMFWMVNVARRVDPGRWMHVQHILQSNLDVDPSDLSEEELLRISSGEDPLTVLSETRSRVARDEDGE